MSRLRPGAVVLYHRSDGCFPDCENNLGIVERVTNEGSKAFVKWLLTTRLHEGLLGFDADLLQVIGQLDEVEHAD